MEIERLPLGQSFGDRHRTACARWVGTPSGLTPELASKFMLGLHGGKTVKDMTSNGKHHICSLARFEKHCQLNPEWGAEARRTSKASFIAKEKAANPKKLATQEV